MADKRFIRTSPIGLLNLEISKGTYNSIGFDVLQEDLITPFDMRDYTSARLSVRPNGLETTALIEISTSDGAIQLLDGSVLLQFSASKSNVQARPYSYDFYVTDAGNEIVFLSGIFKVNQNY